MKLVKPSFEIWEQPQGLQGIYEQIERVGRVCYKSEDKILYEYTDINGKTYVGNSAVIETSGEGFLEPDEYYRVQERFKPEERITRRSLSAKPFVDRMIASKHYAMLEHGTVYLKWCMSKRGLHPLDKYYWNKYSVAHTEDGATKDVKIVYVTTNYRVLIENGWLDDLKYVCEPTEFHEKRVTVHFVCDRGVSHEFVRHRVMSFAQESTRYCNYSKDKFGNEVTFISPCWVNLPEQDYGDRLNPKVPIEEIDGVTNSFIDCLRIAEDYYLSLLNEGWKPQEARAVLPNALKTELVVTGFVSDWNHFSDLRARGLTGAPHPQAKELAEPLMGEFYRRNYLTNLYQVANPD